MERSIEFINWLIRTKLQLLFSDNKVKDYEMFYDNDTINCVLYKNINKGKKIVNDYIKNMSFNNGRNYTKLTVFEKGVKIQIKSK